MINVRKEDEFGSEDYQRPTLNFDTLLHIYKIEGKEVPFDAMAWRSAILKTFKRECDELEEKASINRHLDEQIAKLTKHEQPSWYRFFGAKPCTLSIWVFEGRFTGVQMLEDGTFEANMSFTFGLSISGWNLASNAMDNEISYDFTFELEEDDDEGMVLKVVDARNIKKNFELGYDLFDQLNEKEVFNKINLAVNTMFKVEKKGWLN